MNINIGIFNQYTANISNVSISVCTWAIIQIWLDGVLHIVNCIVSTIHSPGLEPVPVASRRHNHHHNHHQPRPLKLESSSSHHQQQLKLNAFRRSIASSRTVFLSLMACYTFGLNLFEPPFSSIVPSGFKAKPFWRETTTIDYFVLL